MYFTKGYCQTHYGRLWRVGSIDKPKSKTNGLWKHPLHKTYEMMIDRCYNEKSISYRYYGARGISVCDEWRNNFVQFIQDMGGRPHGMTLDRIDSHGNYEPSNCRWSTHTIQMRNKGIDKRNKSGVTGVSWLPSHNKWAAYISIDKKQVKLGSFDNVIDAISCRKSAELKYWSKV